MSAPIDLVVVGGGPGGLAAAIGAREAGLEVLLYEPREGPIDKACGEGLLPSALRRLEALGVCLPEGHPIEGIRYRDASVAALSADGRFRSGPALGVRRVALSRAMQARAAALGVRTVHHAVREIKQGPDLVEVDGQRARYLVAADGLRSPIRRRLGLERPPTLPPRFGLRRHYRVAPWTSFVEVHFGEDAEAYVTPVSDREVGVAFLQRSAATFEATMRGFPLLRERLGSAVEVSTVRGAGPFEQRVLRRALRRTLLVGDAAGYLDPLTGEGVSLALATARAAVACVVDGRPDTYDERYREATARYYRLTRALLFVAGRRGLHRPFLRLSRRLPRVFDAALAYLDGG